MSSELREKHKCAEKAVELHTKEMEECKLGGSIECVETDLMDLVLL